MSAWYGWWCSLKRWCATWKVWQVVQEEWLKTDTPDHFCFYVFKRTVKRAQSGRISHSTWKCHGMVIKLITICPFEINLRIMLLHQVFPKMMQGMIMTLARCWPPASRKEGTNSGVFSCSCFRIVSNCVQKAWYENSETVSGAETYSKWHNLRSYCDPLLSIPLLLTQGWKGLCVVHTSTYDDMVPASSWVLTSPPIMSYSRSSAPCPLM